MTSTPSSKAASASQEVDRQFPARPAQPVQGGITKQEIKVLFSRVQTLAHIQSLTSVHAYRVCIRHLYNAVRSTTRESRLKSIEHAHTHFQFLKAAAAEKDSRQ